MTVGSFLVLINQWQELDDIITLIAAVEDGAEAAVKGLAANMVIGDEIMSLERRLRGTAQ